MYSGEKKEIKRKFSTSPRGSFPNVKSMRFCKCSPLFLSMPSAHLTGHNTAQYSLQYSYVLAEKKKKTKSTATTIPKLNLEIDD